MVLRLKKTSDHKLAPPWEGPYIISRVLHNGAYRLYDVNKDIDEPHAWNAMLLRRFMLKYYWKFGIKGYTCLCICLN